MPTAAQTLGDLGTTWLTAGDPRPFSLGTAVPASLRSVAWRVSAFASFNVHQSDDGLIDVQADLDHTIAVGLQVPTGTVAAAASGLFPDTMRLQPAAEKANWSPFHGPAA